MAVELVDLSTIVARTWGMFNGFVLQVVLTLQECCPEGEKGGEGGRGMSMFDTFGFYIPMELQKCRPGWGFLYRETFETLVLQIPLKECCPRIVVPRREIQLALSSYLYGMRVHGMEQTVCISGIAVPQKWVPLLSLPRTRFYSLRRPRLRRQDTFY